MRQVGCKTLPTPTNLLEVEENVRAELVVSSNKGEENRPAKQFKKGQAMSAMEFLNK